MRQTALATAALWVLALAPLGDAAAAAKRARAPKRGAPRVKKAPPKAVSPLATCGKINPRLRVSCATACGNDQRSTKDLWYDLRLDRVVDQLTAACGPAALSAFEADCTVEPRPGAVTLRTVLKAHVEREGDCAGCSGSGGQVSPEWRTQLTLPPGEGGTYQVQVQLASRRLPQADGLCTVLIGSHAQRTGPTTPATFSAVLPAGTVDVSVRCEALAQRAVRAGGDAVGEPCQRVTADEALTIVLSATRQPKSALSAKR